MPDRRRQPVLVSFGDAVRRQRRLRGWSQEELADRAQIHRTYVADVERGVRNLGLINVAKIAAALQVSLATLVSEVDIDAVLSDR